MKTIRRAVSCVTSLTYLLNVLQCPNTTWAEEVETVDDISVVETETYEPRFDVKHISKYAIPMTYDIVTTPAVTEVTTTTPTTTTTTTTTVTTDGPVMTTAKTSTSVVVTTTSHNTTTIDLVGTTVIETAVTTSVCETTAITKTDSPKTTVRIIDTPLSSDLDQYIYDTATAYGLPYEFVLAVIEIESNFKIKAKSSSNCIGLMQLMYRYNKDIDLYDPYQNIDRGCKVLKEAYNKAGGSLRMAYTYYNLGLYCGRTSPNATSKKVYNAYLKYCNM